ncbi:MAG: CARDB domain-containing protein [Euryarchaeota archaeon]|nr:CARDB domain-containing protein [Euryarchaeota archaeon]
MNRERVSAFIAALIIALLIPASVAISIPLSVKTATSMDLEDLRIAVDQDYQMRSAANETNTVTEEEVNETNAVEEEMIVRNNRTMYVPADHPTIQEAVDALIFDVGIIYVSNGTYREAITIQNQVELIGEDMGDTTIDGCGNATIKLLADGCTIKGFSIINGSSGVKVESDNNTISENLIANNSVGIVLNGSSNLIYHNNFKNDQNAINSNNNSWDDGREGNYWYDHTGDDLNFDGIIDDPYAEGGVIDRYPLFVPFKRSYDPAITHVTVPTTSYINETALIYLGVANYGSAELTSNFTVTIANSTLNKSLYLTYKTREVIFFNYTPNETGIVNVSAEMEGGCADRNAANNFMVANFTVTEAIFERLYNYDLNNWTDLEEYDSYRLPEKRASVLRYMKELQNADGGFGLAGASTAMAILSVASAGIDPHDFKRLNNSLVEFLRKNPSRSDLITIAQYTLAIAAAGEEPRDFGGRNYIILIESFFDGEQFGTREDIIDDAWAILALVGAGCDINSTMIQSGQEYILKAQNTTTFGWGSMMVTALAMEALIASGISQDNSSILSGTLYLRDKLVKDQWDDFGGRCKGECPPLNDSNVINYAHSVQAIIASGGNPIDGSWDYSQATASYYLYSDEYNPLLLLLGLEDEGFKYTFKGYYPRPSYTALAVPAIYAKPYPLMKEYRNKLLPDISPVGLYLPTFYANITGNFTTLIKNDGGIFNVSFMVDGIKIETVRVEEFNTSAATHVNFVWLPEKTGVYNITIIADSNAEINEEDEDNNSISRIISVGLPDLSIEAELPLFYVNVTNRVDLEVYGYGEKFNTSLKINGTVVDKVENVTAYGYNETTLLWKPNHTGNYTLTLIVDSEDDVLESNDENNTIEQNVTVIRPDLYPVNISFPGYLYTYTDNIINVTINGSAEEFNATLWINESFVERITDIRSYTSTNISFTWNPKDIGAYNLTVVIDSDGDINETNETNNNISCVVTVENREAPCIELLSPGGGECWAGKHEILWTASDPNGEVVTINISYSPDAGDLWCPIVYNLPNTGSSLWNTASVPDGYNYRVKVDAFDGNLTTSDKSRDVFAIYNKKSHEEAPGFHYNAGFSLSDAPNTNATLWIKAVNADSSSSLVAAERKIFVYCRDGFVRALDELTGDVSWTSDPLEKPALGSWATAAYHDGSVYVASGTKVYCLDANDGSKSWSFTFPDGGQSVNGGPCIAYGRVYVGSWGGGHYYCLDAESGDELWAFALYDDTYGVQNPIIHQAQSTPVAYAGKVYFGDFIYAPTSLIYAVDAYTGEETWNQTVEYSACGSLTVAHGKVYLMTYNFGGDGGFYALNLKDGEIVWNKWIARSDSTPAHAYGNIYVCGGCPGYQASRMYCLSDANKGAEVWSVPDLGVWTYSPVVADEKVFVGTAEFSDGIYALNAYTGEEIWHSNLGGGSPAILHGKLYSVDEDGKVVCFGNKEKIDLTVISLEVPKQVYEKQNYTLNMTMSNLGQDNASAFNVSFRVNGAVVDEKRIEGLAGNSTAVTTFKWIPEKAEKNCTLVVETDCRNEIVETNPLNNTLKETADVLEGPDIVVLCVGCPDEVWMGDISVEPAIEAFHLEGAEIEVELRIGGATVGRKSAVVSGERLPVNFIWSPSQPGTYNLTIFADPDNDIYEVNDANNDKMKVVQVKEKEEEEGLYGSGSGGGGGSGTGTKRGSGVGSGIVDRGAEEAGCMQVPVNTSGSAGETKNEFSGYPFGNATSGESGGGGTLPLLLIFLVLIAIALFYFGYYKEKRGCRRR